MKVHLRRKTDQIFTNWPTGYHLGVFSAIKAWGVHKIDALAVCAQVRQRPKAQLCFNLMIVLALFTSSVGTSFALQAQSLAAIAAAVESNMNARTKRPQFDFDIRPTFPPVEDLIEKAEKMTDSCFLREQVDVSSKFIKEVALRGVYNKRYSLDELRKVSVLVDYMARRKMKQLYQLGSN